MRKFQRVEGPVRTDSVVEDEKEEEIEYDKLDVNGLDIVIDRVTHGLIGTLKIEDDMNKPILKPGDFAHIRTPQRLEKTDLVLYKTHDEYFIRRIIKFKEYSIYVAGDHEKEYHVIHKEDIIGKVIGRQRGKLFKSFSLNPTSKAYIFRKVNLAYFRLKDRVLDYEDDVNNQALENAMQTLDDKQALQNEAQQYKYDFDLDSELSSFLDPDELVRQLENADESQPEEEIQYVDEFGNPIDPNEISEEDEVVDYVEAEEDEEDQIIDTDESIEEYNDEGKKLNEASVENEEVIEEASTDDTENADVEPNDEEIAE